MDKERQLVKDLRDWYQTYVETGNVDTQTAILTKEAADTIDSLIECVEQQMAEVVKLANDILEKKVDILTIEEWVVIGFGIAKKKGKTPEDLINYLKLAVGLYSLMFNDDWKEEE